MNTTNDSNISKKSENRLENLSRNIMLPFNIDGQNDNNNSCDLNKIFQVNFSYNFDLLKNLLEGILKCQKTTEQELEILKEENKEKNIKIRKLESKLSDSHIPTLNKIPNVKINKSPSKTERTELKSKRENANILTERSTNSNVSNVTGNFIHSPKDPKDSFNIDVNKVKDSNLIKIIVSYFFFNNIFFYRKN